MNIRVMGAFIFIMALQAIVLSLIIAGAILNSQGQVLAGLILLAIGGGLETMLMCILLSGSMVMKIWELCAVNNSGQLIVNSEINSTD
jgi:hypothetical protein